MSAEIPGQLTKSEQSIVDAFTERLAEQKEAMWMSLAAKDREIERLRPLKG
jgi:hypothetical protein